jgi:hypothetical protein
VTISTSTNIAIGRGNGATTQWNFGFLIPKAEYLVVTLIDPAGVSTVLPASAYTAHGLADPAGGYVVYPTAGPPIAAGYTTVVQRVIPYIQPTALANQGGYYPEVVEAALDFLEMQIQQGVAAINTGIHYPAVDVAPTSELPPAAARAGKFFAFDGNGNPTMLNGNLLAGDLLPYTLGGAAFSTPNYATMNAININAGWYIDFVTALASTVQGFSAHIERSAGGNPNYTVGGLLSIQNRTGVTSDVFGIVTEVVNQPGASGGLVAAEFAVGNERNNSVNAKVALDLVFKDRGDGVATVTEGLGANSYNLGAMALFLSSQTRSTAGEFCGWRRGILFDTDAIDADVNGGGIGIDFAKIHYYGGTDPLTAFRMTAAIRLRDYQSILWNGDPTLPNDPTEPAAPIRTYLNSSIGRWVLTNTGVEEFGIDVATGNIYKQGVLITPVSTASNNVWTGTNTYTNTFTLQTDLVMTAGHKFIADFTNATLTSRANFQTSTVNGNSGICAIPNGASTLSSFNVFNAAAMVNCAFGQMGISNAEFAFQSTNLGAGAVVPMTFYVGAGGSPERMRISTPNGQLLIGTTVESAVAGAKLRVNGIVQIDNTVAFRAYLSAAILAASGAFTLITLNTENFDQNNNFNTATSRFTPPAGKYLIVGCIGVTGQVDQARLGAYIFKNGAAEAAVNTTASGVNAGSSLVSAVVDANGVDYFELMCYQTSGVNYTVSNNFFDTFMCGYRIG